MKKALVIIISILSFSSCEKETAKPILDLNETYEGTYTGWSQPMPINGVNIWTIRQVQDSIFAEIETANLPNLFEGVIIGDTLINGRFKVPAYNILTGQIIDFGQELIIKTSPNDPTYNYFRIEYIIKRKQN
jgi:hypothetical protein